MQFDSYEELANYLGYKPRTISGKFTHYQEKWEQEGIHVTRSKDDKGKYIFDVTIEEWRDKCLTLEEIYQKYNIQNKVKYSGEALQNFFLKRGLLTKQVIIKNKSYFLIEDDSIIAQKFYPYPVDPDYEVTKSGIVRTSDTKKIIESTNEQGYKIVKIPNNKNKNKQKYYVHRMVMETFNPIKDSNNYMVDHINGKRNDNRLENLRWVTARSNAYYRDDNFIELSQLLQQIIQKFGYEETKEKLKKILNN